MYKSAIVIHMQVGENDLFYVIRRNAERAQLRTDFLLRIYSKPNFPSDVGVERTSSAEQMCSLAGVNHNNTFTVLDHPGIGR
jgi:hypothetical protein